LSWQAVGILPALQQLPTCCCARTEAAKKRCPICLHEKEVASGQPLLKTCGMHDASSMPLALFLPVLPARAAARATAPKQALPRDDDPPVAPSPSLEVPTPPPLA